MKKMKGIKDEQFLTTNQTESLSNSNSKYTNGFLILLDIINSTSRKKNEHNWVEQTKTLYNAFSSFCSQISEAEEGNLKLITEKLIGDGMMVYFQTSEKRTESQDSIPPQDLAEFFIKKLLQFLYFIENQKDLFSGLALKSVLTYLTNIRIVDIDSQKKDVLGRGIDFSFRLEKFGDSGHIVINQMLAESLKSGDEISDGLNEIGYRLIPCCKKIKGWDSEGESFSLLVEKDRLEESYMVKSPSKNEDNVYLELFKWYIKELRSKKENDIEDLDNNLWKNENS